MKLVTIVGARPQFIKLAPLSRKIRHEHTEILVHTGQHYTHSLSDDIFRDLELPEPLYNLGVGSGSHGKQTAEMLEKIESVLKIERPDCVIVFGDTNSTVAGSLAAAKLTIPVVHIEAGLRSYNREMPEEINRVVSDHTSDILLAPTRSAMNNLRKEGLADRSYLTGDIMVDTLMENIEKAQRISRILSHINVEPDSYYLLTLHRPYNVDKREVLERLIKNLSELDVRIIFPVHPRTSNMIKKFKIETGKRIILIEPAGYLDFISLMNNCRKIITDSGGIQKEAYLLKKPCITVRSETEWIETVEVGWNMLLRYDDEHIKRKILEFHPNGDQPNIFGECVTDKMLSVIENNI